MCVCVCVCVRVCEGGGCECVSLARGVAPLYSYTKSVCTCLENSLESLNKCIIHSHSQTNTDC